MCQFVKCVVWIQCVYSVCQVCYVSVNCVSRASSLYQALKCVKFGPSVCQICVKCAKWLSSVCQESQVCQGSQMCAKCLKCVSRVCLVFVMLVSREWMGRNPATSEVVVCQMCLKCVRVRSVKCGTSVCQVCVKRVKRVCQVCTKCVSSV